MRKMKFYEMFYVLGEIMVIFRGWLSKGRFFIDSIFLEDCYIWIFIL